MTEQPSRHIGVDATCWLLRRGFGRHARCLLGALVEVDTRNRYTLFVDSEAAAAELPGGIEVRVVRTRVPTIEAASADGSRSVADLVRMSRALSAPDIDVLLFPTLFSYVPTYGRARRVLIVHDATAEMYPALTLGNWKNRALWAVKTALGRAQADVLVTVSDYSRRAIAQRFGIAQDRLHVVGEAADPVFRRLDTAGPTARLRALNIEPAARSLVYLGGFSPHKNIDQLIRVFARLSSSPSFNDLRLFLVGDLEGESFVTCHRQLTALVETLGLAERVTFTGFLPDEDVVVLLNLASVLVLPSLTEGLGLPAFEAAACGCPVVATTESPLPGLLGDGGRYVDPRDEAGLERTLEAVLGSAEMRQGMREAGLRAARGMSWQASARRLVRLIDLAASS